MDGCPTFSYEQDPFEGEAPAAPQPPYPFKAEAGSAPMSQEPLWEESRPFEEDTLWQRIYRNFYGAYSLIIVCLYLVAGFCFDWWHPAWLLFLTIPIYYAGLYGSYPVLVTLLFLLAGFCFGWWHPAWLLFLTIPLFYLLYHPHSKKEADPEEPTKESAP